MPAEVGTVYIKVRAITDKLQPEIQKALSALNSGAIAKAGEDVAGTFSKAMSKGLDGNIFTKVGQSLSDFGGEAGSARDKIYELSKAGYIGGTAVATLLGAVSSLIGGLGGLIGVVGGAVPAVMGLVGAFVSLRIGMAVGQFALEGIMQSVQKATTSYFGYGKSVAAVAKMYRDLKFAQEDAAIGQKRAVLELEKARANLIRTQDLPANSMARKEALLAYQEAELNLKKAKAKNKDAALEAKNPQVFSGTDPYAGLTATQTEFAKFLTSMQVKLKELREAAAKALLPVLEKDIKSLLKTVFPTFKQGIVDISTGLAGMATNLTAAIENPHNVELLGIVMKNIGDNLPIMGSIMGNVYSGMLTVLKASDPLVKRFLNFLNTKTKTLSDWLKAKDASGELQTFFDKAGNIADKLWKIFEQAFGGLGAIIGANFDQGSGGWIMLDWLDKITKKWDDMDSTVSGKQSLKTYFQETAKNSTSIMDAVGALGDEFLKLGANKAIRETFDNLKEGAPAMGELGKKLVEAGPSLGKLVADITKFINAMTDSKAIQGFFNTIDGFVKGITAALNNPIVGPILTILGRIHGVLFGIIATARLAGLGFKYMGETTKIIQDIPKNIKTVKDGLETLYLKGLYAKDGIVKAGKAFADWGQQIGTFVVSKAKDAATAISDLGTKGIDLAKRAGQAFADWGKQIGNFVVDNAKKAGSAIAELSGKLAENTVKVAQSVAGWVAQKAALVASTIAQTAMKVATAVATGVQAAFNAVMAMNPITLIVIAVAALAAGLIWFFTQTKLGQQIWAAFVKGLTDGWNVAVKAIGDFFAAIPGVLAKVGTWFSDAFNNLPKFIGGIWTKIVGTVSGFVTNIVNGIDKVFPGFKTVFNNVVNFFKGIINSMIGMVESYVNFWIRGVNLIVGALNKVKFDIPNWVPVIGGQKWGFTIPLVPEIKLPRLAKGGTVMPSPGGSLVNVAEAGRPERIEPLDSNGLSNRDKALVNFLSKNQGAGGQPIQIIVNPSADMNERDIAEIVSRKLAFELRRGGY